MVAKKICEYSVKLGEVKDVDGTKIEVYKCQHPNRDKHFWPTSHILNSRPCEGGNDCVYIRGNFK